MFRVYFNRLSFKKGNLLKLFSFKKKFMLLVVFYFLFSCGRVYFPLELKTISRQERSSAQEEILVELVAMTKDSIIKSNKTAYKRSVVESLDLTKPAQVESIEKALI